MYEEDIRNDYSCGNCGWTGETENTVEVEDWDGDLIDCCPNCNSSRVGAITDEDFMEGNALHGKTWFGRIVY